MPSGERSLGDVDVVFPILHGRFGEDGTIQGLLELVGLPYVGNGVLASAVGMDKHFTKTVLEGAGIEVAPWVTVTRETLDDERELWARRARGLGLPAFVKPARAGSSVGRHEGHDMGRARRGARRSRSPRTARCSSRRRSSVARSSAPCSRARPARASRVSVAGEIVVTGRDFYDFDAKYLDAPGVELICPADLGDGELFELQRIARRAFEAIGGAGLARVDLFLTGEGFVVNEINTMPGFTPISMFPTCWLNSGLSYPDLITELIEVGYAAGVDSSFDERARRRAARQRASADGVVDRRAGRRALACGGDHRDGRRQLGDHGGPRDDVVVDEHLDGGVRP